MSEKKPFTLKKPKERSPSMTPFQGTKREEGFLNYGRGWGTGLVSQENKASTIGATSDAATGQFADAPTHAALITHSLEGMPTLKMQNLLWAPLPLILILLNPLATNSPDHTVLGLRMMSDDSPAGSQRTTVEFPPDNEEHNDEDHLPTPNVRSGTPDLIMDQPPKDQPTQQDALPMTGLVSIQPANDMVDPLQVLLASAPPVMGSPHHY